MGNSQQKPRKPWENPEDEEESSRYFTCQICFEPKWANNKFKNTNICKHRFCPICIANYIEVKVVHDNTAKIKCPEPSCQHHLEPLACRDIISPALFSTWCRLLCESSLLGYEKSYCPNRDCLELVVNECSNRRGKIVKKCKCPNCQQMFCFQCQTVWHAGFRCEESEALRDRNDVLFGQLVEVKKWNRCPGCGQCVEKLHGCYAVRCRCKTVFCYECGEKATVTGCGCMQGTLEFYCEIALFSLVGMLLLILLIVCIIDL